MPRNPFIDASTASRLELSDEQRAEFERRFEAIAETDRRYWRGVALGVGLMIVGGFVVGTGTVRGFDALGLDRGLSIAVAGVLTPAALAGLWFLVLPRVGRGLVRRVLRTCGHDVCEGCGYDLRGLAAGEPCPECGRAEQSPLGEATD